MNERPSDPVTPPEVYFNRRRLLKAGLTGASLFATGTAYRLLNPRAPKTAEGQALAGLQTPTAGDTGVPPEIAKAFRVDEPQTSFQQITTYNNFYEFGTDKEDPAVQAKDFKTAGWQVQVDGLCGKPQTFDLDTIRKISPPEERVYRMRCVEAWSMVIPWAGYSLGNLLDRVEPQSGAKYVAFTTLHDPSRMPGQKTGALEWPYVEGLRMDEAMHPLAILATGLYGRELPPQDGAPVRLVVPWKYGFKGIKSIVKISLVAEQPVTSWNRQNAAEYGFYANVNPKHDHPRWSQASERRIGEGGRRPTLMFNGYAEQVGRLYSGMDLDRDF